jgi:exopolyphosphatase/guanosine-5'-triphosphate,3'-diphosphate pyrophosphatase
MHFTFAGCMAELTALRTDTSVTRTLVIESEDRERVIAAVRALGLEDRRNTCVARGLKALTGFGARRFAVIDTGTNSVKFHLSERGADGAWTLIADRAEITRLGEGLDRTGQLAAEPIERTATAIAAMIDEAQRAGAQAIAAVGTAGLRIAPNGAELIAAVRTRCGVEIEVLSGEEEARLAYLAATAELGPAVGTRVVFDTGGGSSLFTFGDERRVTERFSVNVGAVRLTERFGLAEPTARATLAELHAALAVELERLAGRPAPDAIVGMGGAVTNLAAVSLELAVYDPDVVQGTVLSRIEIDRQIELYRNLDAQQRRAIVGLQPNRADVILAGACIVRAVLSLLVRDPLTVSDRGLRHGLLSERFVLGAPMAAATTAAV